MRDARLDVWAQIPVKHDGKCIKLIVLSVTVSQAPPFCVTASGYAMNESSLVPLKTKVDQKAEQALQDPFEILEAEQKRYCNL